MRKLFSLLVATLLLSSLARAQCGASAGSPSLVTRGTIASATDVVTTPLNTCPGVLVSFTGTYAGATVNFEISDDSNFPQVIWYPIACVNNAVPGTTLTSDSPTGTVSYSCALVGASSFRVRASALTSGSASVKITQTNNVSARGRGGTGGGGGGSGTVTSLAAGTGITLSPNPITTTGTIAATSSVSPGTANQFATYTAPTTVGSNPHLDDGLTTPATITSTETMAIPLIALTGTAGTGFAATSVGGTLPTLSAGQGGLGIGTGGIPQMNVNGGGWINIPTGGGGAALSALSPATAANTIANGNNPQTWNWAQTTASQTAFSLGESAAATGAGDNLLGLSTASNSTATALNIAQGSITGTTSIPALNISTTLNNAGLTDNVFAINISNTASNLASTFFTLNAGATGTSLISKMDTGGRLTLSGLIAPSLNGSIFMCGGNAINCSVNQGAITSGSSTISGTDNVSTAAGAGASNAYLRGGMLTAATPNASAMEGLVQITAGFLKGAAVALAGDIVCMTTTAFTVTDCSHTGPVTNIVGIATSTANPIVVVAEGTVQVSLDNTVTNIGDFICMGTTTDGKGHGNGSTACTAGQGIGVVIATSGTVNGLGSGSLPSQTSITLSTSLPLVMLHIR